MGRTPDQIIGKTVASVVGADSELIALLRQVLESGEPYSGTLEFTPPGSARTSHYRVSYVPDIDGDGRTVGVLTNVVDVTELSESEHRQAQEALRTSEERYRLLHDTMLQGVVYQDADGTIISMNPAAVRILGKRPEDFLGLSSVDTEHDTLREDGTPFPGLEHPAMVALRTGEPVPDVLMQVYNPREAQYRLISIQAVPLFRPGRGEAVPGLHSVRRRDREQARRGGVARR